MDHACTVHNLLKLHRAHQALGMLTPAQFLAQSHKEELSRTS